MTTSETSTTLHLWSRDITRRRFLMSGAIGLSTIRGAADCPGAIRNRAAAEACRA
jgi:hypothetical protein